MEEKRRGSKLLIVIILIIGMVFGSCFTIMFMFLNNVKNAMVVDKGSWDRLVYMSQKYEKFEYLYNVIEKEYYGEYDEAQLMESAYKGMFQSLDRYSTYMNPDEYKTMIESATGSFSGVGIGMSVSENNEIIVMYTIKNSPAEKGGMKAGDIITKVDGESFAGSELDVASAKIRGPKGTKVEVTFYRDGKEQTITLIRDTIETESVNWEKVKGENIGYIQITTFEATTADEFEEALRDLEGDGVEGLIIDIRSNGGGVVDAGIAIADMLLEEGNIISTENSSGETNFYNSKAGATELPYVVLINEQTASTSEILAVAIKENGGGKLVGKTSFGKGVVQKMTNIPGGQDAYKVTFEEYFGPNHVKINGVGIEPDYEVDWSEDEEDLTDYQLEKAIEVLLEQLEK